MVERSVNKLPQTTADARLRRLEESSARVDASIKGCHAAIDDMRAFVDVHGLQLSGHIHNVSSSLDDLEQRVGLVACQEATNTKACERIA